VGCKSAFEIRTIVELIFNSINYKGDALLNKNVEFKEKGMTMREYLTKIKTYCDPLGVARHRVLDTKHGLDIMNGFDEEYEAVVVVIPSRKKPNQYFNKFIQPFLHMMEELNNRNH